MNFRLIINILIILLPINLIAQTSATDLNQTDRTGKKQGHWIKKYPNNTVMYDGFFKDNYPVGEFKRFNDDGSAMSTMVFSNYGKEADAKIYHQNGFLAAKGLYINQKKEGPWQFFSEFVNGYLVCEESYKSNLRNGTSVKFYPDGTVAEKLNFVNDTAQGEWTKYYPNGAICLKSTMKDGKINGIFEAWFENGNIQFSGEYMNDKREGSWEIYEKDGKLRYKLQYTNGTTSDRQMDIDNSDYLDSLEKNKGKIPDPEQTGPTW